MNVRDRLVRQVGWASRWRDVCGVLLLGGCSAVAAAEAPTPESWESLSVRELMQQDLRQALDEMRGGANRKAGGAPIAVSGPVLAPRLVALYGVGRALMAEVQVGRNSYLYVKGQTHPAGHAADASVYQLRGMNGACIQLERGDDRHSLCLRMLLGEVQP